MKQLHELFYTEVVIFGTIRLASVFVSSEFSTTFKSEIFFELLVELLQPWGLFAGFFCLKTICFVSRFIIQ